MFYVLAQLLQIYRFFLVVATVFCCDALMAKGRKKQLRDPLGSERVILAARPEDWLHDQLDDLIKHAVEAWTGCGCSTCDRFLRVSMILGAPFLEPVAAGRMIPSPGPDAGLVKSAHG